MSADFYKQYARYTITSSSNMTIDRFIDRYISEIALINLDGHQDYNDSESKRK